ncbi:MAG: hypothetical protein C0507_20505 [Cyanobacteria bacterium PR.3.49]|nr:hypothetical protein [Cyanobacteria bacterium PR.3.49]
MSDLLGSPDGVIECFYASLSFSAGQTPNYNLMHSLFHKDARIIPPATDTGGKLQSMSVEEFIEYFDERIKDLVAFGGREEQTSCKTSIFHTVAHVFSAYRFMKVGTEQPIARGINSLHLVYETGRWWIINLIWDRAQRREEVIDLL